ncbi:cyclin-dependent kinase 1-like [Aplysia californica]|uniref:Cyclin-dependent kinase 1-like n=1 Tax=Aplysia californica TaxID=6500 RepID=A0ABM0K6J2_APLCA|nr:cyclin-dependent kinase 1-like [Aplysia californica]
MESLSDKLKKLSVYLNEVTILKELSHPNIVELQKALSCREDLDLVSEPHSSDLVSALPRLTSSDVIRYFTQTVSALITYLHQRRIVHDDVKPQNVLIHQSGEMARLCDFGFARRLPEN